MAIHSTPQLTSEEEEAVARIGELKTMLRWQTSQPRRWLGSLRRLTFAKAVQGSNSIEGYDAGLDDVLAAVEDEEPLDAATETVSALQGYRDALTYVLQLSEDDDQVDVDESLLRSLHYMMLKYDLSKRPGRWRRGAIFVQREKDGEVVYEGPDVELVPNLIRELLESLRDPPASPMVAGAMAHLNLVMIHPFSDGNGRMARCLQTLVLTSDHVRAPVFSSIEEYLGRNTEAYYHVLAEVGRGSFHPENDARPWLRFCINAHFQQAHTLLWRVREAEELWDRCQALAAERGLPDRVVGPLSDAARGLRIRNAPYRRAVQEADGAVIEVQTASRDLKTLVDGGLLIAHGATRGRYYVASPTLRNAWVETRKRKGAVPKVDLFGPSGQLALGFEGAG